MIHKNNMWIKKELVLPGQTFLSRALKQSTVWYQSAIFGHLIVSNWCLITEVDYYQLTTLLEFGACQVGDGWCRKNLTKGWQCTVQKFNCSNPKKLVHLKIVEQLKWIWKLHQMRIPISIMLSAIFGDSNKRKKNMHNKFLCIVFRGCRKPQFLLPE